MTKTTHPRPSHAHLSAPASFAVGEHVNVSLPAEHLWVLPPEEGAVRVVAERAA